MLTGIPTPAAIVDQSRMMHNISRMQDRMNALGVSFRPHVKTAKCVEVAQRQQERGARGITVSTLKEAESFYAAGFKDILYAACITPNKLDRALALRRQGCELTVIVDSLAAAQAVANKGKSESVTFDVMIEVDTDGHRSGVTPGDLAMIEIAQTLNNDGSIFRGLLTHAGSSYELNTHDALQKLAEQERRLIVFAAGRLRAAGIACEILSVGSTPTALSAKELSGITEVRAGVYVFFDLVMVNIGVCTLKDIALSVLTTVTGHQIEKGWAIIDAGWMAMSRDRGTQGQACDYGYGMVCDSGGKILDNYVVAAANQEHGILSRNDDTIDASIAERFPIGSLLRILPNHACATGAQFSEYNVLDQNKVSEKWKRFDGW